MKKNFPLLAIGFLLLGILAALAIKKLQKPFAAPEKSMVSVSIAPQKFFVEKIAGDTVKVNVLVSEGFNPETFEPSAQDIKNLLSSKIVIISGQLEFEKTTLPQLLQNNPKTKIIDTSKGIDLKKFDAEAFDEEHHVHADDAFDPHIWVSPRLVKQQLENIYQALLEINPQNAELYLKNKNNFLAELDQLDKELEKSFSALDNKQILVYHPAFGYLADDYGFEQISIEIEGKEVPIQLIEKVISYAKQNKIKTVFVQKQFDTKAAQVIATEIDGKVVTLDPLAEDYLANLRSMAQEIKQANNEEK